MRAIPRAEGGEGPLAFGTDVNAMRFIDGEREDASAEALDAATAANLTAEGCTLQVGLLYRFAGLWGHLHRRGLHPAGRLILRVQGLRLHPHCRGLHPTGRIIIKGLRLKASPSPSRPALYR